MKLRLLAALSLGLLAAEPALACSYPKREHPILASQSPASVPTGQVARQVALEEALLPAKRANPSNVWYPWLQGVRGALVEDGQLRPGRTVTVRGQLDLVCFYPSEQYRIVDGRLIVWVVGIPSGDDNNTVLEIPGVRDLAAEEHVWKRIRWDGNP